MLHRVTWVISSYDAPTSHESLKLVGMAGEVREMGEKWLYSGMLLALRRHLKNLTVGLLILDQSPGLYQLPVT